MNEAMILEDKRLIWRIKQGFRESYGEMLASEFIETARTLASHDLVHSTTGDMT